MQNKKAKKLKLKKDQFEADLYQYELLHDRPVFRNTRGVSISASMPYRGDELKNAKTYSVSTYGLFYKECDEYDMRVYSASHLNPIKSKGKSKDRAVRFNNTFATGPIVTNGIEEFADCENLVVFEDGIRRNLIGEPIYHNRHGSRIMPALLDFIRKTAEDYQEDNYITGDSPFEIPYNEGDNDNEVLRSLILNLYLHSDKIVAISL